MNSKSEGKKDAELLPQLVESIADYAIFMLDPKGHVLTWNTGAQRIKGYAAEEILHKHFSIFYPRDDVRAGKCELELEAAAREGRFEDEGWRLRKDRTRFWANVVITAMRDEQGALIGFAKVTRDLTERRRIEEEQAARQAAEHANRAKDEFLAMLGHELRNPLAPIVTALQLMKLRGEQQTSREQQIIERQVAHMLRLVDDLLDVSRITRGTIELKRDRLDMRDVVTKAVELASPLIEQRRHRLEVSVPPTSTMVDGDDARLTQVLANLLVNAAKYTEPGGHITVLLGAKNDDVLCTVRDNGPGIERDALPTLFDLFVRGRGERVTAVGGLGIGLTLVKLITQMHGGDVHAYSGGPGRGSSFLVRLPRLTGASPAAGSDRSSGVRKVTKGRRILLVDDNEDALCMLSEILSAVGHEVEAAPDAAAALRVVHAFKPEIGVLDIGLPVMNGYVLATRLRDELGTQTPRLIALTGYGQQNDRERAQEAGFDAHFVKPVDTQSLLDTIEALGAA